MFLRKWIGLVCLFISFSGKASTPTLEALLRNGSNADVTADTVVMSFSVKEVGGISGGDSSKTNALLAQGGKLKEIQGGRETFVKIYLTKDKGLQFLQVIFDGSEMKTSQVKSLTLKKDFTDYVIRKEFEADKDLFYASLLSLAMNSDRAWIGLLKKTNSDYKPGHENVNQEKLRLFERMKKYFQMTKGSPGLKNSIPSPLKPDNEEERTRLKQALNSGLYLPNGQVSLQRISNQFLWHTAVSPFLLDFTVDEHLMKGVHYDKGVELVMDEYTLLDGTHKMPKFVGLRTQSGDVFVIRFLELIHLNTKADFFEKTLSSYPKNTEKRSILPFLY